MSDCGQWSRCQENKSAVGRIMNGGRRSAFFDSRLAKTMEPAFQMKEADWSQYDGVEKSEEDKAVISGAFYGYGFPSKGVRSNSTQAGAEIGKMPQRYREASDSEWDASGVRKETSSSELEEKHEISSRVHLGRLSYERVVSNRNFPESSTPSQSSRSPFTGHAQRKFNVYVNEAETYPDASTSMQSACFTSAEPGRNRRKSSSKHSQNPGAGEKVAGKPSWRRRQSISKTDFEHLCNVIFNSDDESEIGYSEDFDGTSKHSTFISDAQEDFVQVRPTSLAALCIDKFVNEDREEMLFDRLTRDGEKDYLDSISYKTIQEFLSQNFLASGALSVTVDLLEYPPQLATRPTNRLLRPVIIDGAAVAGCFDKEYSVHWGSNIDPTTMAWNSFKVLPMKPICLTVAMFLLRGHKVTVLLPKYYCDASIVRMRNKVDDVEALKIMQNLQIVQFVQPRGIESVMDAIRREVDKVDALLISSGSFDTKVDWSKKSAFPSKPDRQQALPTAFTKASRRMLTPTFYGRNRDMTMSFGFHTKEDGTWRIVAEEHMCYYEPHMDSDLNIDDEGRLCQQLLFEDQVHLLVALKDLFEWPALYRRGISAVLRLDYLATSMNSS